MIGVTKQERERFEKISELEEFHAVVGSLLKTAKQGLRSVTVTLDMCYDGDLRTALIDKQEHYQDSVDFLSGQETAIEDELIDLCAPGWVSS